MSVERFASSSAMSFRRKHPLLDTRSHRKAVTAPQASTGMLLAYGYSHNSSHFTSPSNGSYPSTYCDSVSITPFTLESENRQDGGETPSTTLDGSLLLIRSKSQKDVHCEQPDVGTSINRLNHVLPSTSSNSSSSSFVDLGPDVNIYKEHEIESDDTDSDTESSGWSSIVPPEAFTQRIDYNLYSKVVDERDQRRREARQTGNEEVIKWGAGVPTYDDNVEENRSTISWRAEHVPPSPYITPTTTAFSDTVVLGERSSIPATSAQQSLLSNTNLHWIVVCAIDNDIQGTLITSYSRTHGGRTLF